MESPPDTRKVNFATIRVKNLEKKIKKTDRITLKMQLKMRRGQGTERKANLYNVLLESSLKGFLKGALERV